MFLFCRPEDLRRSFEKFGPLKDIYLPKNYYTGEPRGFGFVKYRHSEDAAEAKQRMDHKTIGGREIRIVFAEENRKTPQEMRRTTHVRDRGVKDDYHSRRRSRSISHSLSPRDGRDYRADQQSLSPRENGQSPGERDHASGRSRTPRAYNNSPMRFLDLSSQMAVLMLPFYAGRDSMESNYKLDEGCVFGYDLWISFGLKDLLSL
ncbi:hypothetical protein POTOM_030539 [Populus tomentosa]|uniref:RRM domain-containing protein n=1 Tax=Populus tomentosa TaxID=118781 RepID=A0A8X7ZC00_POPTO|nr:hypothetical protein POTOM_030539 [Populus tomentosa]